jgi:hypothetical protein
MGNLSKKVRGLRSRRVTDIEPARQEPTRFMVEGGWASAEEARGLPLDPIDQERSERRSGALALAELERQRIERLKEATDREFAGIARGIDYSKGIGG